MNYLTRDTYYRQDNRVEVGRWLESLVSQKELLQNVDQIQTTPFKSDGRGSRESGRESLVFSIFINSMLLAHNIS